jgi:hypothetical protein
MKLSHLYESVDHRRLLKEVAQELGFQDPQFYDIDDATTNAADVQAGIDLFHVHLDTDGSAQIKDRVREIEKLAMDSKPLPEGMEAFEAFEDTSFEQLPHVHQFYEACKQIKATAAKVRESAQTAFKVYFLLAAVNGAATTTMSSKYTADEVKYRASIARACMKQLGMTPKDL